MRTLPARHPRVHGVESRAKTLDTHRFADPGHNIRCASDHKIARIIVPDVTSCFGDDELATNKIMQLVLPGRERPDFTGGDQPPVDTWTPRSQHPLEHLLEGKQRFA